MARQSAPSKLAAYRLELDHDEIVLFVWEPAQPQIPLTKAEEEVLAYLLDGWTNRAIADARRTSPRTIANQVAALLRKLGAGSRFELLGRLGRSSPRPHPSAPAHSRRR
jgi:DNA-binding NarL/FixJ family response regulator